MRSTMILTIVLLAQGLLAQQADTKSPVPRLVRVANTFRPANGEPVSAIESVTLSIYRDERGGDPLWSETQNVNVDSEGNYSALLGSTLPDGVPADLFATGEPRWLGVRFNRPGEDEQRRVMLVSVPYAMKAADAETLGGRPASDYMLAAPPVAGVADTGSHQTTPKAATLKPKTISGQQNYLSVFTDASNDIGSSILYQAANKLVLGTTAPKDYFTVTFADTTGVFTGYAVQNTSGFTNAYSGMLFYDQNGALGQFQGFNNSSHEYRINNIASNGSINFMLASASKFKVTGSGIFLSGVNGTTTGQNNAVPLLIDSNGQIGTISSSRRYKEDIQDMADTSRNLMRLRPVTFRYKKPFADGSKPIQYGLIAEEVAEVYPDLVARGADGQIETVKYQLLPTMLLNEVQRQEHVIAEQQREIDELKLELNRFSSLEARLSSLESASARNQ